MKKSILLFLIFIISASVSVQAQYYEIYIHQNRVNVPLNNNVAYLESEPFEVVVYMSEPMTVSLSASLSSTSYDLANQNAPVEQIPEFRAGYGMADAVFNPQKNIYLSDEGANQWYYESSKAHAFDDVVTYEEGGFHAYRRVELINSDAEYFNVREIGQKMVYLVFLASKWNDDYTVRTEVQMKPIVLSFR